MIRRHPILGFFAGLLIGLGLAILLVIYSAVPVGSATVIVVVLVFAVIGVLAAWVLPARHRAVVETTATTTTVVESPPSAPPEDRYRP